MKEILLNSLSTVGYKIYVDGVLTNATGAVTVTVTRNGVKVVDSATATAVPDTTGTYRYLLPVTATVDGDVIPVVTAEGILSVTWSFTVSGGVFNVTEYYDVVTPYCSWDYFADTFTYVDYLECERVARFIINSYCGQEFGQEQTTYSVEGHGTNALGLPRRLQTLDTVEIANYPEPRSGQVIGYSWPYPWEIVGSGWTIRQQPYAKDPNPTAVYKPRFFRNKTYNVAGLWGYPSVPTEVEEAAKILTADFICKEAKYRDKYLDNIKMGDWRIQFAAGAFQGTGNVKADQLLRDYKLSPGIGLI
jgi:hypothetical protein